MQNVPFHVDILLGETRNGVYVDGELFSQEESDLLLVETWVFIVRQMGATVKGWIVPLTFPADADYPVSIFDLPLSECSNVPV